jgi:hypothetical protein
MTHKSKKPGFWQFLGGVTSILEKTRFLATPRTQRNRVFRSFYDVWRSILEKTRFLITRETKETGFFAVSGRCGEVFGKKPGF